LVLLPLQSRRGSCGGWTTATRTWYTIDIDTATSTLAPAPNLLQNPSFANDLANWAVPSWLLSKVQIDPAASHDGDAHGLTFSPAGSSVAATQDVVVTPGRSYSLRGHVQVNQIDRGAFKAELIFLNRYNGTIGSPISRTHSQPTGMRVWDDLYIAGVAPANAAKVRVQLKGDGLMGNVGVDDLVLVQEDPSNPSATPTVTASPTPNQASATATPTATPSIGEPTSTPSPTLTATPISSVSTNLLINPSFRSPLTDGWTVSSWAASSARIDRAAAFDGDQCGLLQSSAGESYVVSQDAEITPGRKYRLNGHLKLPDLRSGSYTIQLVFLSRYGGTVGSPVSVGYSRPVPGWQTFNLEGAAPSGAAKARVLVKISGMKGTAYLDALELVRTN
jgi:hypothetical protein